MQLEKMMEIISKEVMFSFGKVLKNPSKILEVELKIKFGEDILETILVKREKKHPYINALKFDPKLTRNIFYFKMYNRLFVEKENREVLEQCKSFNKFNDICEYSLSVIATEEFKKTSSYKMKYLYDPDLEKIFR
jgi:hypothetical protein